MRVVWATAQGSPDVLTVGEAPEPSPGEKEVIIEVEAAALAFVDTMARAGSGPQDRPRDFPFIPGRAAGGEVIAVGDGVDSCWLGRRVLARTGTGALAELVAAPASKLIPVPDALPMEHAVALFPDGNTALALVETAAVKENDVVLVLAAAGGLGTLLVQLARLRGAQVVGAARGPNKLEKVRDLGAVAVDYSMPGWAEQVRSTPGGGASVIFDGVGGDLGTQALAALARGGRLSVHGAASGRVNSAREQDLADRGARLIGISQLAGFADDTVERMKSILDFARRGLIRPVVGQAFSLEEIREAHRRIESRATIGQTLVLPKLEIRA